MPEPICKLYVPCIECEHFIEALLPLERDAFAKELADDGWFLSVMTRPGEGPITFAALCPSCAKTVYSPELLKAAEESRKKLLS